MVLNRPETSLHPDLLAALARVIAAAAERPQVNVVTHARLLIEALSGQPCCHAVRLEKTFGETIVMAEKDYRPAWYWPPR